MHPYIILTCTVTRVISNVMQAGDVTLPIRVLHLPMAFNERWTHGAIQKYMRSVRSEGPYLPSNVDFVAANNGLTGQCSHSMMCQYAHARTHACTHACTHARTHACTHACTLPGVSKHMCVTKHVPTSDTCNSLTGYSCLAFSSCLCPLFLEVTIQ